VPFRDKILLMEDLYWDTERQFLEFAAIIPYDHNPDDVYSPRLVSILRSAGSQIDGLLKIITERLGLTPASNKYPAYYECLNQGGMLQCQKVTPVRTLKPFKPFTDKNPPWWKAYNDTKHGLPEGAYAATLVNTLQALGALYVLHHIGRLLLFQEVPGTGISQQSDFPASLLKAENWYDFEEEFRENPHDTQGVHFHHGGGVEPLRLASGKFLGLPGLDWGSEVLYYLTFFPRIFGSVNVVSSSAR